MALNDIVMDRKENLVEISLGGKNWTLRFPVRAFKELQDQFGGWQKAWAKATNNFEGSTISGDLDYDVLAQMLEIGIHDKTMPKTVIAEHLGELMQDEVALLIPKMIEARNRWSPEPENNLSVIVEHLSKASELMNADGVTNDGQIVEAIKERLRQEVEIADDPLDTTE